MGCALVIFTFVCLFVCFVVDGIQLWPKNISRAE